MSPQPGDPAPDFALADQFGRSTRLSELLAAGPVVLVFFPLAFSSTCRGELGELRDHVAEFDAAGVRIVGVSVDSKHTLRAWAEREGFAFTLLSDFWPHGEVARAYGAFLPERGFAARATFVIDEGRVIRSSFATGAGEPRTLAQYRAALASLSG
ncbi:peroxiredoxin [Agromyces aerolatus]|uniref:peroxiredoxin n=1 Tax=Agromyces sp. LY-1074 TaxID=3074080 RepID=UPI00286569AA|nr:MULTISPECIES: peroxiredoxin [unclassified Agromyces]MDR5700176.1 peroxiredoxin [Agromyces sp. LY-1074]MDR5706456.1 peroxiredoxin [Agromyces sp. LY-1358]